MLPPWPEKKTRLAVQKTYKLFIGGKFVRSESGRVVPAHEWRPGDRQLRASFAEGFPRRGGGGTRGFRRLVETKRLPARPDSLSRGRDAGNAPAELEAELARAIGEQTAKPNDEASLTIDRLVHYAGWTDKFSQVFSAVNPVASSHFNFTMPEPTGVVVVVCPNEPSLLALVSLIAPVILSGNTAVVLTSDDPAPAGTDLFRDYRDERSARRRD